MCVCVCVCSEAAFSCFTDFKEDKNIDQWHRKAAPSSGSGRVSNSGSGSTQAPVSLSSLDYLLCQLVAMRAVVMQYQYFLAETCGLPALAEDAAMLSWLELDASYTSLEGLYLQCATSEALQHTATRLELLARAEEKSKSKSKGSAIAIRGRIECRRLPWQQLLEVSKASECGIMLFSLCVLCGCVAATTTTTTTTTTTATTTTTTATTTTTQVQADKFSLQVVEDFFFVLQVSETLFIYIRHALYSIHAMHCGLLILLKFFDVSYTESA
jgi:hypothetical protein